MRRTKLKQIGPTERAIGVIDDAMKELRAIRGELIAQLPLPKAPKKGPMTYVHPVDGLAHKIKPVKW